MAIDCRVPPVTLRVVDPVISVPSSLILLALIVGVPCASVVATPVADIVAIVVLLELQVVIKLVISAVDPSEKSPVAVKLAVRRDKTEGVAVETVIDWSSGLVTVSTEVSVLPPKVAVIVVGPTMVVLEV
jgi:hypothetical protein